MNKKTILCIIDMQSKFSTYKDALDGTLQEIKLAKRRGHPVALIAYAPRRFMRREHMPKTFQYAVSPIEEALSKSNLEVIRIVKFSDNGEREIRKALRKHHLTPDVYKYRLVGVNRCYCVMDTALGMRDWAPSLEISWQATGCYTDTYCEVNHDSISIELDRNGIKVV